MSSTNFSSIWIASCASTCLTVRLVFAPYGSEALYERSESGDVGEDYSQEMIAIRLLQDVRFDGC